MKKFTCVQDIGDLKSALAEAFEIKKERFKYVELGRNKTLMMIFFNSSLRTRLSTQKAAINLGMNVMVLDINQGAWKLETERGVIMDGDKPEHILEAIPVMGCYCDIIGVRSFARFEDRDFDYQETIINQFIQYSGRPVFSMEAATRHPLQSFADLITIEEYKKTVRPKVVMTWAPHPRPLPQAVPNSFAEWMNATDYEFVITHPEGYELDPQFVGNAKVEYMAVFPSLIETGVPLEEVSESQGILPYFSVMLLAYSHGIFPWFSFRDYDEPLWYCPQQRFVIFPEDTHNYDYGIDVVLIVIRK